MQFFSVKKVKGEEKKCGQIKTLMLILPSLKNYFNVKTKKAMGDYSKKKKQ
jgi:hypothetical protein